MMVCALILALGAWGSVDSPNVWLAAPKGNLTRAGRDGDSIQVFDVYPKHGSLVFRGRQIAFASDAVLTWITAANGTAQAAANGKQVIGWRDTEPLLWDGISMVTSSGLTVSAGLRSGDTPVFATIFGNSGLLVSQTSSGSLRIVLSGPQPLAADFGAWRLVGARMITASSGYLVLEGAGWNVVRIAKGRADVAAIDSDHLLGMAIASDGKAYITRHTEVDGVESTDIDELMPSGPPEPVCRLNGSCEVVDLDRAAKCVYAVRTRGKASAYLRIGYLREDETVLREPVQFVTPAFGGAGFVAEANPG